MSAQTENSDSLVRLIFAEMAKLEDIDGKSYRKFIGNVKFFHNDTYLRCDSAYWNITDNFINALGNVCIEQNQTTLTGDSLKYIIDDNLAKFRGHLVELKDGDGNTLRTNNLDYNTKDSIGIFFDGASMIDEDGNIIESNYGRYESKKELFTFIKDVEMFSDSLFFVCDTLEYDTDRNFATFRSNIGGWYRDNALSSEAGWYDREREKLFFRKNVHGLTEEQEVWCDSLNYDRHTEFTHMRGNVQITDTVNSSIILSGDLRFWNEPRRSELYRDPAIIMLQDTEDGVDSVFLASDRLYYHTERMFEVDSMFKVGAKKRYEEAQVDPLAVKKSEDAKKAASEDNKKNRKGGPGPKDQGRADAKKGPRPEGQSGNRPDMSASPKKNDQRMRQADSTGVGNMDTLAVKDSVALRDSLAVGDSLAMRDSLAVADSIKLPPPPDTTQVNFVRAVGNVRAYMDGMQMRCDSLDFNSIDSLVRLYTAPVLWHEINTQITADSIRFLIEGQNIKKGFLYSNSFVASSEEDAKFFHQIKSPEMIGYFEGSELRRFDALGGVNALLFMVEDSLVTTMNQKDCRIMSGILKNGSIQRVTSFESAKSDAYPIWSVTAEQSKLKGFSWTPEKRPKSGKDITFREIRGSERAGSVPDGKFPTFRYTTHYFEGHMEKIFREIDRRGGIIWKDSES